MTVIDATYTRSIVGPDQALAGMAAVLLRELRLESRETAHAYTRLLRAFAKTQDAIHWLHSDDVGEATMAFSEACQLSGVDPDAARETILSELPADLQKLLFRGIRYTCPFCGSRK